MKLFVPLNKSLEKTETIHRELFEISKKLSPYEMIYSKIFRVDYVKDGKKHFAEVGKQTSERVDNDIVLCIFMNPMYYAVITMGCALGKGSYMMIDDKANVTFFE